jgi:hypothetical protein
VTRPPPGSIFYAANPGPRDLLGGVAPQARVQEVSSFSQLVSAINNATYRGPLAQGGDGAGRYGIGNAIIITEPFALEETIVVPSRVLSLTIAGAGRFTMQTNHTDVLFSLASSTTTIRGIAVAPPIGGQRASRFANLVEIDPEFGSGGASFVTIQDCISVTTEFVHSLVPYATGGGSTGVRILDNDFYGDDSTSTDGINVIGDQAIVRGNNCFDTCDVTFDASASDRICALNNLQGGTITNADVHTGLNT